MKRRSLDWSQRKRRALQEPTPLAAGEWIHSPLEAQDLLCALAYNREPNGATLRSALTAWRRREAHCLEAAFLSAFWLEMLGHPPVVLSFESEDGLDHVVSLFLVNGRWGAIGRSRDEGLHGRRAVFRSIRELARSYQEPYVDLTGRITAYQWVHLDETESDWRASDRNVWRAERYLLEVKHRPLRMSDQKHRRLRQRYIEKGPIRRQSHWLGGKQGPLMSAAPRAQDPSPS